MTSLLVPRPIAWVGTQSRDGVANLAPFSYFMGVSSRPPALAISVARLGRAGLKDTARNILDTGVFSVSMVSQGQGAAMVESSLSWPASVSEFDAAGLQPIPGETIDAPRPAGALAAMECRLIHQHDLGSTHLFVGEVLCFHVADAVLAPDDGQGPQVDPRKLDPLARLGGIQYAGLGEVFSLVPPKLPDDG